MILSRTTSFFRAVFFCAISTDINVRGKSTIHENMFEILRSRSPRSIDSPSNFLSVYPSLEHLSKIVMPPDILIVYPMSSHMIFEESDDYPEGAHYFLEYQIFKRDPENYHGCFEIEFLV